MDNERFQEIVLKKLEKLDSLEEKVDSLERNVTSLDKRQGSLECDFKVMLKMMEKFGEKQDRLEKIVLMIENDSMRKVRSLFEKSDIHDNRLDNHESRLKILEGKE